MTARSVNRAAAKPTTFHHTQKKLHDFINKVSSLVQTKPPNLPFFLTIPGIRRMSESARKVCSQSNFSFSNLFDVSLNTTWRNPIPPSSLAQFAYFLHLLRNIRKVHNDRNLLVIGCRHKDLISKEKLRDQTAGSNSASQTTKNT
jgi:hypothetical protein